MTQPALTISRASIDDLPDAQLLLREYYEAIRVIQRDSPADILSFLTDPGSALWIVSLAGEHDRELAGCVVLRPLPSIRGASECKRLYVRPLCRGRGIASALLDAMESFARDIGLGWIYLDSKDDLGEALRIYTRRGYTPCERYNDNPQATIFLRKQLSSVAA